MDDKRTCARCSRPIDPYARICPYCNWDQSSAGPPPQPEAPVAESGGYVPPAERNWRRHLMIIGGAVLLLIASFFVGAVINRDDAPENAPEPILDRAAEDRGIPRTRRADVRLVPFSDPAAADLPITSAPVANPAEGIPTEYQRRDATAVSSGEYAALAQRAQEERRAHQELVDPRSITGPAYAQAPRQEPQQTAQTTPPTTEREPSPPPMTSASSDRDERTTPLRREPARVVERTRPVPQSQPLPRIVVDEPVTARLELTIGADGRVKQVRIKNSLPGHTPELIAAVQRWRFKPATENGVPVSAPFTVDISFKP